MGFQEQKLTALHLACSALWLCVTRLSGSRGPDRAREARGRASGQREAPGAGREGHSPPTGHGSSARLLGSGRRGKQVGGAQR